MTPAHQFPDQFVCDLSLFLQEFENLRTKQVFKRFEVCLPHHIKSPGITEKSVSNNGMQVGMEFLCCVLHYVEYFLYHIQITIFKPSLLHIIFRLYSAYLANRVF